MAEWMAYYQIEPFGQRHKDLVAAIQGFRICNAIPIFKRREKPYEIEDFYLETEKKFKQKTVDPDTNAKGIKALFKGLKKSLSKE